MRPSWKTLPSEWRPSRRQHRTGGRFDGADEANRALEDPRFFMAIIISQWYLAAQIASPCSDNGRTAIDALVKRFADSLDG